MYVMGIDSGSTSTNAVIMDGDRKIVASAVVRTGAKSGESAQRILDEVLEKAGLKREDISWIVSTGYGRVSIDFADENVTEISCHGRGAHYFNPKVRTILDIGGQDSKAIHLSESGGSDGLCHERQVRSRHRAFPGDDRPHPWRSMWTSWGRWPCSPRRI